MTRAKLSSLTARTALRLAQNETAPPTNAPQPLVVLDSLTEAAEELGAGAVEGTAAIDVIHPVQQDRAAETIHPSHHEAAAAEGAVGGVVVVVEEEEIHIVSPRNRHRRTTTTMRLLDVVVVVEGAEKREGEIVGGEIVGGKTTIAVEGVRRPMHRRIKTLGPPHQNQSSAMKSELTRVS